jgi:hypothetical protein
MPLFDSKEITQFLETLTNVKEIRRYQTSSFPEQETLGIDVIVQSTGSVFYITGFVPIDEEIQAPDNVNIKYIEVSNLNDGSDDENGWTTGLLDDGILYAHLKSYLFAQGFKVVSNRRAYY